MSDLIPPRMFEFHQGTSDKFWKISLSGTSHTVRYGRSGTDGQSKTKDFPTVDKAKASYEKLIKQKTSKGYAEVTDPGESRSEQAKASKAAQAEREPFVRSILENPDEASGYLVYADWLDEHEDPRAELIRVQWELEDESVKAAARKKLATREKALLRKHEADWLEDLADDLINQTAPDLGWRDNKFEWAFARGHLDRLRIGYLTPAFASLLKKSPLAALLRTLFVQDPSDGELTELEEYADRDWDYDDTPGLAALAGTKFENLRSFTLSEDEDSNCHINGRDAHRLLKGMPRLEHLQIDAHDIEVASVMKASLPELRTLELRHTAGRYPLEVLARNKSMTHLQRLAIHPHAKQFDDDVDGAYLDFDGFKALCRSKNLGGLRHLSLKLTDFGDEGIKELLKSSLFQQLQTIDFEYGMITDEGAKLLAEADLSHLELLNVNGNYLTKEGADLLRAASKKATADEQLSGDPHDEEEHLWYGDIE